MKNLILVLALFPALAFAEETDRVNLRAEGNKTIEIRTGDTAKNKFEITDGSDNITGDTAPLLQEARKNWKKACDAWKTELKDLNKNNQILSMSCGDMNCSTVAMESSCKSEAKYKLKVQVQ
jgi:hypothetical protein